MITNVEPPALTSRRNRYPAIRQDPVAYFRAHVLRDAPRLTREQEEAAIFAQDREALILSLLHHVLPFVGQFSTRLAAEEVISIGCIVAVNAVDRALQSWLPNARLSSYFWTAAKHALVKAVAAQQAALAPEADDPRLAWLRRVDEDAADPERRLELQQLVQTIDRILASTHPRRAAQYQHIAQRTLGLTANGDGAPSLTAQELADDLNLSVETVQDVRRKIFQYSTIATDSVAALRSRLPQRRQQGKRHDPSWRPDEQ